MGQRVLHVIPAVAPRYGGPSTAIWPMTATLAEQGYAVELATTSLDGTGHLTAADLPMSRVPTHLFRTPAQLRKWLTQHVTNYDWLHIHSLWNRVSSTAARLARQWNVPYVLRPCGMLSQYTWSRSAWKKWVYWHGIERQTVRGAARIHATSSVEAHDCRLSGVTAPIAVIPLGIDSSAFASPPQPHWLRAKLKDQIDNEPIVLFLSRVHPKKGIVDFLLPAFAKLTIPAHLVILGGVDDSTPRHGVEILVASHRLGIADRVSQLGAVPPAERWSAYDGAAVFCLPSRSENFGIVVTEAMARGCPVVVSDAVDASEHVERAGAGLRVLLNVDALTQALEAVLTHPADAGTRGREYVRQHLCWDSLGPALAALYTEVPT